MRLLVSWLRDFVDIQAPAPEIAETLGLRGFEVASIEPFGDGDTVIDFEVTANRPDCLSVLGLAREVATAYQLPIKSPALSGASVGANERLKVTIDDPDLCPRYAAAVADVAVGVSPSWIQSRLQGAGLRPINTIVDVTNYVLVELGHPTHAFDLARLAGGEIRVRRAASGEKLTTLDGVERTLGPEMLVIADCDRAQAIAGVMGGAASEVSSSTRVVAFESAYFKPASVRRTSKRLGLKTEASARFERGADINGPMLALRRISALLEHIGAKAITGDVIDVFPVPQPPTSIRLRRTRLASLLGVVVPDSDVTRILQGLELTVTRDGEGWDVVAPTFRVDLLREVDLIEEVARHYGFDKLPETFPVVTAPAPAPDSRIPRDQLVRRVLTAAGFTEAVTFGFIDARAAEAFQPAGAPAPVAVANPLSAKFDTLRMTLLPGLVDAVAHNRRHGLADVRLFEIGARFSPDGETRGVAVAWTGSAVPPHWSGGVREVDFFDIKGVAERLCDVLGGPVRFEPAREPFLVAGRTAAIVAAGGERVGIAGQVAPATAEGRGLPRQDAVFVAEIHLDLFERLRAPDTTATRPLPRFPSVVRDLSIVVSDALPAAIIHGTIQAASRGGPAALVGVNVFDRYQGAGVPEGRVSLSLRFTFQAADRTLTDAEVQQSFDTILGALAREHAAVQR